MSGCREIGQFDQVLTRIGRIEPVYALVPVLRTTWFYPIPTLHLKLDHSASRTQPVLGPCSKSEFINGAVLVLILDYLVMHSDYTEF